MNPANRGGNKAVWIWIIIGLGMQLLPNANPGGFGALIRIGGTAVLIGACALYAENKGYSRNYGLLAILSILGVIVLVCLPRRNSN